MIQKTRNRRKFIKVIFFLFYYDLNKCMSDKITLLELKNNNNNNRKNIQLRYKLQQEKETRQYNYVFVVCLNFYMISYCLYNYIYIIKFSELNGILLKKAFFLCVYVRILINICYSKHLSIITLISDLNYQYNNSSNVIN